MAGKVAAEAATHRSHPVVVLVAGRRMWMVSSQQQDSILGLCDNSSTARLSAETKRRRWWVSPVKDNNSPGLTPFTSYLATWRLISFLWLGLCSQRRRCERGLPMEIQLTLSQTTTKGQQRMRYNPSCCYLYCIVYDVLFILFLLVDDDDKRMPFHRYEIFWI